MSLLQTPSLLMYNKMLKSLADGKSFTKVLALFGELRGQGLYPDNFTLPVVLKSIGRLRKVIEGEKVHGYAVKTGLEFDSYVSNSLMLSTQVKISNEAVVVTHQFENHIISVALIQSS